MSETTSGPARRTVLYDKHLALGARFVPFSGWEMPVNYSDGIIAEHLQTRKNAALFDICHMGEFRVSGPQAERALDRIVARTVRKQQPGTCRYNFLLDENGGVKDDIIVYRMGPEEFFIVVNAGTKDGDADWIRGKLDGAAEFADESDFTAKLDLQGPESGAVLESLGFKSSSLPGYYKFIFAEIAGAKCLLSRTGYTGELGYEIYIHADHAGKVWDALLADGRVKPAGLGARDTLRLEMAYPLYGHELNTATTPIEAGFGRMLDLSEDRVFIGGEALRNSRPRKKLVGIELDGKRAAREGSEIMSEGAKIGEISSGSYAPSLGRAVALGYVPADFPSGNGPVEVFFKKIAFKGCFSELPFYKNGTARK